MRCALTRVGRPASCGWQEERIIQRGQERVSSWVWLPAPSLAAGDRPRQFDPKPDLQRLSAKEDYSMGLVDYCPIHGVNVALLHGGCRCPAHMKMLKHIHAKRDRARSEAAQKENQKAFIRLNGIHGPPR